MEALPEKLTEKLNVLGVISLGDKVALVYDEYNNLYEAKLVDEQLEFTKVYTAGDDRYV